MIENKKIMAKNILRYMNERNVTAADICKALGFKQNTFSDWVNAKTYPRIDKIELMARYFQISKANLVEEPEDTEKAKHIRNLYINNSLYELNDREIEIIEMYRIASPDTRRAVLDILHINHDKKRQDSELFKVANDK